MKYIQSNRTHKAVVLAGLGKEGDSFGWPETQENQDAADVGKLGLPEKEDSSTQRLNRKRINTLTAKSACRPSIFTY